MKCYKNVFGNIYLNNIGYVCHIINNNKYVENYFNKISVF